MNYYNIYWKFTKNNIFVNIIKNKIKNIYSCSTGKLGFKNKRKLTPFAVHKLILDTIKSIKENNILETTLQFNGVSIYKQIIIDSLTKPNILNQILKIINSSKVAYNGCKQKKKRRI